MQFRLQSRIDCRHIPYVTKESPTHVEQGLAYSVEDADWRSPGGEEIQTLVEDDDRYTVDWGNPQVNERSSVILFKPLPHMPNESSFDLDPPSDPDVLEKAWSRFAKVRDAREDILNHFYRHIGELCDLMSPKDSFTFRLEARSCFDGDQEIDLDEPVERDWGLQYRFTSSTAYDVSSSFKQFVEEDDRYAVVWGKVTMEDLLDERGVMWVGHIDFRPKVRTIRGYRLRR